ncbi:MAG TPA: hypothetical protein VLX11_11195 [Candidatus Acidoferrales bacterium]|nr:hypothetical protein [Candidatus Acidoferrales bacterium]
MEIKTLDEFPVWSIYTITIIIAIAFSFALVVLIRSLGLVDRPSKAAHRSTRCSRPSLVFLVATALALWFMGTSMFYRFHAVAIGADRIELLYFWPRPSETIHRSDLVDIKVIPAYRTCGHMIVVTREKTLRSINFKKCTVAQEILEKLSQHANMKMDQATEGSK